MNWKRAWNVLRYTPESEQTSTPVTIHMPSPLEMATVYRKDYSKRFHTTSEAAFAEGPSFEPVRSYTAFKAGGKWYGFRGHFERIEVVNPPEAVCPTS
jgi:hypothetical protein